MSCSDVGFIFIGADQDIYYNGAKDANTGVYLNSGTCTFSVQDSSGNIYGTGSLPYVAASNGNYWGFIPASVTGALVKGNFYYVYISFIQGGYVDYRALEFQAQYRRTK